MKKTTFQDFEKQWYFSLTQKCSWNCWYCDFPKIQNPNHAPIEYVLEVFNMIKEVTGRDQSIEYSLEGGEIGLFDEEYLDKIFDCDMGDTYNIATNGLFMKKGYHKRYHDKIHYLLYHVQPELTKDFMVTEYETDILTYYTFVINKRNLPILSDILKKCESLNSYVLPHILQPRTNGLDLLSKDDFIEMYNILKASPIIKPDFITRVERIIDKLDNEKWLSQHRSICANVYTQPIFDLPNKRINRCCISISGDSVPITYENIEKLYKNEKMFDTLTDRVCDGCIANFLWHDFRHKRYLKEVIQIFKGFAK
jgi:hypothetical protein